MNAQGQAQVDQMAAKFREMGTSAAVAYMTGAVRGLEGSLKVLLALRARPECDNETLRLAGEALCDGADLLAAAADAAGVPNPIGLSL